MVVLLNSLLSKHVEECRFRDLVVSIIKSIVLHIVAEGCDEKWHGVDMVELSMLGHILCFENDVAVLGNVWPMEVIMVVYILVVFIVDLAEKLDKFGLVNMLEEVILLHEGGGKKWHLHISTDGPGKLKYVEFEWVYVLVEMIIFVKESVHGVSVQLEINLLGIDHKVKVILFGCVGCVGCVEWLGMHKGEWVCVR